MAEKLTTFAQLKKLAVLERNTIGDKISELAGLMAEGLEDARHGRGGGDPAVQGALAPDEGGGADHL